MESGQPPTASLVAHLLRFGGFPEPFLRGEERFHRRWMRERSARVVHEDLRDLEQVREVSRLDLLLSHLPACVGSPLSVNRLARLLQASHESVERWITILERLYVCYRLAPFEAKAIRAVRKEKKLYFWDWSRVDAAGARFENMVAGHLLKYCHLIEDTEGYAMEFAIFAIPTDARSTSSCSAMDAPSNARAVNGGRRLPAGTFGGVPGFPGSTRSISAPATSAARTPTRGSSRSPLSAPSWLCRSCGASRRPVARLRGATVG